MRVDDLLDLVTQGALLLIAVLTLADLFRHRDRARIDIALMFGALAAIVLIQGLTTVARQQAPWLGQLGAILLLAQPYLLLRLVQHFRSVPRVVRLLAMVLLLAGINLAFPAGTGIATLLSRLLALLCMLSYYFGFVPPHWLRQAWQLAELQRFLRAGAGRAASARAPATLNQLCLMGTRAVGGLAAAVALGDQTGQPTAAASPP